MRALIALLLLGGSAYALDSRPLNDHMDVGVVIHDKSMLGKAPSEQCRYSSEIGSMVSPSAMRAAITSMACRPGGWDANILSIEFRQEHQRQTDCLNSTGKVCPEG